jgi:hypothetical protein
MNVCPNKAVQTAHGFMAVMWIGTSLLAGYMFSRFIDVSSLGYLQWLQNEHIQSLLTSVVFFPILFVGYRIMHWLMRFSIVERTLIATSLTSYKFWGRYFTKKSFNPKSS